MQISDEDIISETTQKAHRNLMAIAASIIIVKTLHIPTNEMKLLNMQIPDGSIDIIAFLLLAYALYSLIVQWMRDLASWKNWHGKSKRMYLPGTEVENTTIPDIVSNQYKALLERIDKTGTSSKDIKGELAEIEKTMQTLIYHYKEARRGFRELFLIGAFMVFFHHLILPVALSLWAVFLLYYR